MARLLYCVFILTLILTFCCAGSSDDKQRILYEKIGGFSYDPPKDWQITEIPGLKYRFSRGPRENEFTPNIGVVDETFSGTLKEYVEGNLATMKKMFTDFEIIKQEDFVTEDGQSSIYVITKRKDEKVFLRQTFYFFSNSNRKYVVTCTALADKGEMLDELFMKSMKTFRTH